MPLIKKIISLFITFVYLLWPNKFYYTINKIINYIHTEWLKPQFKHVGNNICIKSDFTLIGSKHISIYDNTCFGKHCILTAWDKYLDIKYSPEIIIGRCCNFGEYNHITAINKISIGNGVLTGRWVTITDNSHGIFNKEELDLTPLVRPLYSKGDISIGDNVWIGDKVTILSNVSIGKGCIIAANSVVTKDIPEYCMIAGVPARIIKKINIDL